MIGAAVFIAVGIVPHIYSWCADYEKKLALYKAEGALDIIGGKVKEISGHVDIRR